MSDTLKDLIVYIFPSAITAMGFMIELRKVKAESDKKIREIEKTSETRLQEIRTDMEEQAKLYESNAKTDLVATALKGVVCDKKVRQQLVDIIIPQLKESI